MLLPDRYVVQGELGHGGMGVVYRALDQRAQRLVAIKLLTASSGESRRFTREAEQLAELSHPNVVAFYDNGRHESREFLVMELAEGGNLLDWLRIPRPLPELIEKFAAICAGLEHIHKHGIVHRDLKPENILLTKDGTPKISDFGLARRLEGCSRLTADGAIVGTYSYLAPEQIASSAVGPPADLYALGVVLYEAVTGRSVFTAPTEYELLQCHVKEVPVSPRAFRPDLPPTLERLILRMLRKNPQERPKSAAEVARLLTREDPPDQPLIQKLAEHLPQAAILTAPHGLGRSRLVWELAEVLTAQGLRVLTLIPEGDAVLQVGQLYAALGGEGDRLSRCLVSGGPPAGAEALRQRLAAHPKTVLLIDDLDRLDATSQAVLRELARRPGSGWLISLACDGQAENWPHVFELPPLLYDEVRQLAADRIGKKPSQALTTWLAERGGGSPRRLKTLLLSLFLRDGGWNDDVILPDDPDALLKAEVVRLDEGPLRLLKVACLLTEPFSAEAVRTVLGSDPEGHLTALIALGLLEETPNGLFLFSSPEVRQHLSDGLPDRTRRRLFGLLAKQAGGPARAVYLSKAEQPAQAVAALLEEAERCQASGAFAESYELWQRALACLTRDAALPLKMRILLGCGEALAGCRRTDEAVAQLENVIGERRTGLPEERVWRLSAYKALAELKRDDAAILHVCRQGLQEAGLPPEPAVGPVQPDLMRAAAGLYRIMARVHVRRDEAQLAARIIPGALSLARHAGDTALEAELLVLDGRVHRLEGRSQACEQSLFKSLRMAQESLGPFHTLGCQLELGRLYLSLPLDPAGIEKAEMSLGQALELARELADAGAQAEVLVELAWLQEARSLPSLDSLRQASLLAVTPAQRVHVLCLLGLACQRQHAAKEGEEHLRSALKLADRSLEWEPCWALGHGARRADQRQEAEEWFRRALEGAEERPIPAARSRIGLALVWRHYRSAAARTEADQALRLLQSAPPLELALARWAQGGVRVAQGEEGAGAETLRQAERMLGTGFPPLDLVSLVLEAREDVKLSLIHI